MKKLAIIGGHTEWAKSLGELIKERELDFDVRAYSSSEKLGSDDFLLGPEALEFADILVMAMDGDLALGIAKGAVKSGKRIVDLVGVTRKEPNAIYVWPMLDAAASAAISDDSFALIANGLASPIVAVLRALSSHGLKQLHVATYESAASHDRPGMDELLDQCRSVCAMQESNVAVFPEQLAFNAMPMPIENADELLAEEIKAGLKDVNIDLNMMVSRILIPTFSAEGAVLHLALENKTSKAQIEASLKVATGVQVPMDVASTQSALQRDDALVSKIQVDGSMVKLWLCVDRLRGGSVTPAAILLQRWTT